jgi:hypothetical protein
MLDLSNSSVLEDETPRLIDGGGTAAFGDDRLYRVEGSSIEGHTIFVLAFRVDRKTKRGCWIEDYGRERFILNDSRKRLAYPTKEEAMDSFIHRKVKHIAILRSQIDRAVNHLETAKKLSGLKCDS